MKICGIYKITSPSNKVYIGQSVDIIHRWIAHKSKNKTIKNKLYSSFKRYGIDNHKFEIICQCDKSELNNLEVYYIELFQCFDSEYGLNLLSGGGSNITNSQGTRKKISISNKGRIPWNKGLKTSDETRRKISENRKGKNMKENHPCWGKKRSPETCEKLSKANKGRKLNITRIISTEQRIKISNTLKGRKLSGNY